MSSPHTLERLKNIKRNYRPFHLQTNFRSSKTVVDFNNRFFEALSMNMLAGDYLQVYVQLAQQPFSNKEGHVSFRFFEATNQEMLENRFVEECSSIIHACRQRGYSLKDIAVLCRANSTASRLASELILLGIPVISQESLLLKNVPQIKLALAIIQYFRYNNDVFYASQIFFGLRHCGTINSNQLTTYCLRLKKEGVNFNFLHAFREIGLSIDTENVRTRSIYKVVSRLVDQMGFQKDDPFILKFLDFAFEYDENIKLVNTSFIDHWEENCKNLSIELQEGVDAVQVMTIHKSKGLEFPVVVYPGINFHQKPTREQVWTNVEEYLPDIPHTLLPVQKALEGTSLEDLYTTEMAKSKLDQLNVAYVACTRAVSELYVLGKAKDGKPACKELEFLVEWEEWAENTLAVGQPCKLINKTSVAKSGFQVLTLT